MIPITTMYLTICVIIFSVLSMNVIKGRRRFRILLGAGDNEDFLWLLRGHGNFAEYAPMALLALAAAEASGANAILIHLCGIMLITGRLLHAYYFIKDNRAIKLRIRGMQLTFFSIWGAAATAAVYSVLNYL